jgi:hypothetical protein
MESNKAKEVYWVCLVILDNLYYCPSAANRWEGSSPYEVFFDFLYRNGTGRRPNSTVKFNIHKGAATEGRCCIRLTDERLKGPLESTEENESEGSDESVSLPASPGKFLTQDIFIESMVRRGRTLDASEQEIKNYLSPADMTKVSR